MTQERQELRAIARRFGPDPARRFYQLDERLLWDRELQPTAKIVLLDMLHRANRGEMVPSQVERAEVLGLSRETICRMDQWLEQRGYIIRVHMSGMAPVIMAAWPPIPADHPDREAFQEAAEELAESFFNSRQAGRKSGRAVTGSATRVVQDNAATFERDTYLVSKNKREQEEGVYVHRDNARRAEQTRQRAIEIVRGCRQAMAYTGVAVSGTRWEPLLAEVEQLLIERVPLPDDFMLRAVVLADEERAARNRRDYPIFLLTDAVRTLGTDLRRLNSPPDERYRRAAQQAAQECAPAPSRRTTPEEVAAIHARLRSRLGLADLQDGQHAA